MKKGLVKAMVATLAFGSVFGMLATVQKVKAATGFSDVQDISPYYQYISDLQGKGVVTGYQGNFDPFGQLTRAQFAVMLVNAFGLPKSSKPVKFTDSKGHWGATYIQAGVDAGIISGTSPTTFAPDQLVTREQAAALIWRMLSKNGVVSKSDLVQLDGSDPTDTWAQDAVKNVLAYKLYGVDVQGGVYHGQKAMVRQEAAALFDLALKVPATPKTIVVNPTRNENNLIDQPDGSKLLGNITLDPDFIQGNNISADQLMTNLNLYSQVVLKVEGANLSISLPATGSEHLIWNIASDTKFRWAGASDKNVVIENAGKVAIDLVDSDTAAIQGVCTLIYKNGSWASNYPKF